MKFKWAVDVWICIFLLVCGQMTALAHPGVKDVVESLKCTHDLIQWASCDLEAENCSQYSLTLQLDSRNAQCIFKQCNKGRCCCSAQNGGLDSLFTYSTATVWRSGERVGSKNISFSYETIKPPIPTITQVRESNGNYEIMWKSNMESVNALDELLTANVTYYKKEGSTKVPEYVWPPPAKGQKYCQIVGRLLEPSTTYMVCVKNYLDLSNYFSDCSEEREFTTHTSEGVIAAITIASLSVAAIVISIAIYCCYLKLKAMWLDKVCKCPNPKLLDMHSSKHQVLKPRLTVISSVCVEPLIADVDKPWSGHWLKESHGDISVGSPQQSSGISTGSSCLSYANAEPIDIIAGVQDALGKAFANISPISPLNTSPLTEFNKNNGLFSSPSNLCGVKPDDINSGSSSFDNRTYSILIPSLPQHIKEVVSAVQTTADLPCDSAYHPSEGDIVICTDQQLPACPLFTSLPGVSAPLATDMSYQQCNADSVSFLHAEDSSCTSVSSGSSTSSCNLVSGIEAGCECSDEVCGDATKRNVKVENANVCDDNPCYGCVPVGSSSFPPVEDDYQAFQCLVETTDVLFSDQQSAEKKEHLIKYPEESFTKMPETVRNSAVPGFTKTVQDDSVSLPVQPLLSLLSAVQPLPEITDSAYQSL